MNCWVGSWAANAAAPVYFVPETIMARPEARQGTIKHRSRISAGGERLRLRVSNEAGTLPLKIGGVSVGQITGARVPVPVLQRVQFHGSDACLLAPGESLDSDPVDMPVSALAELLVSVFYPEPFTPASSENVHLAMFEVGQDTVMEIDGPQGEQISVRPTVVAVSVEVANSLDVVVCLGDSLTDGAGSRSAEYRSWTDVLFTRMHQTFGSAAPAVVNAGIGGNQLLGNLIGRSALQRFESDILKTPGISHLVVFIGINDIGAGGRTTLDGTVRPMVTTQELIDGYIQITARAHEQGITVFGATLLPFRDSLFFLEEKEAVRLAVNHWIRTSGNFDAVIDFEIALRSPTEFGRLNPTFDSGDSMHPNALGQQALGESVPLGLFRCEI